MLTCKPEIRRRASVGDWVLGTGSAAHSRTGFAVYAMRVEDTLRFAEYWSDERFRRKRPNLAGSRKTAFGDNIYRPDGGGGWVQVDSHHSLHDGSANPLNVATDTRVDRVLISRDFVYWGGEGPQIPAQLRAFGTQGEDVCPRGRADRCRFSDELVAAVVGWIDGFDERGIQGRPGQWPLLVAGQNTP